MPELSPELSPQLAAEVAAVDAISLTGAPDTIILDPWVLNTDDQQVAGALGRKLEVLGNTHNIIIPAGRVALAQTLERVDPGSTIAICHGYEPRSDLALGMDIASCGSWMNPGAVTDMALGVLGTAIRQEVAGVAFRSAGRGHGLPTEAPFRQDILEEVRRATIHPEHHEPVNPGFLHQIEAAHEDPIGFARAVYAPISRSFGPSGALAAAPAPENPDDPNYFYMWQRDMGQSMQGANAIAKATGDAGISQDIQHGVRFLATLPSRIDRCDGVDLGVSRCTMDGRPVRDYGSPQYDGPAHSALAIMGIEQHPAEALRMAKPYADFIGNLPVGVQTYDAWEFSVASPYNGSNLSRRALLEAANIAEQIDDPVASRYRARQHELEAHLESFYDPRKGYILAGKDHSIPWMGAISGLDIAVIGSVLTAYDVRDDFMNVDDPRMMATMRALERAFADKRWPVNEDWRKDHKYGMGLGRFPEDTDGGFGTIGGNPWSFATLWASQYYYRLHQRALYKGEEPDTLWLMKADGYLDFVLAHVPKDNVTEQIDAFTGLPRGAGQLSWAHAELINTVLLRSSLL
jgi:hypothetical protein